MVEFLRLSPALFESHMKYTPPCGVCSLGGGGGGGWGLFREKLYSVTFCYQKSGHPLQCFSPDLRPIFTRVVEQESLGEFDSGKSPAEPRQRVKRVAACVHFCLS